MNTLLNKARQIKDDEFCSKDLKVYRHKNYSYYTSRIKQRYRVASLFSSGLGLVKDKEGYYYINKYGEDVFNKRFMEASSFDKGVAIVKDFENHGYYYINTLNQDIYNKRYKSASIFVNGLAVVEDETGYYYINKVGLDVFKKRYSYACRFQKKSKGVFRAQVIDFNSNKTYQVNTSGEQIELEGF